MKRVISIAVLLCVTLVSLCGCGEEKSGYPEPTSEFYVNDFADIIESSDEEKILAKAVKLEELTTAQVVVATVNELDGKEPYEYASDLANKWGIGNKEKDNGVLILLSLSEREIFIATGEGTEAILPASKTGRIIDVYGIEKLKNDDFSGGLTAIFDAVVNEIYVANGLETPEGYVPIDKMNETEESTFMYWIIMVAIIIVLTFITRRRGGIFFVPTHFYGGSFGGRGGGSGGFGGFSGGGGSFGGGGAGRGF